MSDLITRSSRLIHFKILLFWRRLIESLTRKKEKEIETKPVYVGDFLRHCPKNEEEKKMLKSKIKMLFSDSLNNPYIKTMLNNELDYGNIHANANWDNVKGRVPEKMNCQFYDITENGLDKFTYTVWALWQNNGTVTIVKPRQNIGVIKTKKEIINVNDPADIMPDNICRAAKIIIGPYLTPDNTTRGFTWELYKNS